MNLSTVAAKGAVVTLSLQGARFILQFAGLVILGRLLDPAAFGLVAMVTAVIGVGDILREFGLIPATVHASELSEAQRSNLFWFGALLGLLVAVIVCACAPLLALIYGDDRVIVVALVLSCTFVFGGLQAQFQAGLARQLRFGAISSSDLFAQAVGLTSAILAAVWGWSYWALVLQLVMQSFALLLFRAGMARWLPGLPNRKGNIRPQITYGRSLVMTQVLVYASSNIDSLLVGSKFGAAQLGFYNRAFQILMMPLNQILNPLTTVALPILAKLKDENHRFNRYVQRAQIMVAYPTVVLFAFVASAAHELIRLVFGAQWDPSAYIFQILSVAGAFQAIGYVAYWVFLSKGLTASHFRFSLITRTILIASILCGSLWGPEGIAAGYCLGVIVSWPLGLLWLRRAAELSIAPLTFGGLRAAFLGIACALAGLAPRALVPDVSDMMMILLVLISVALAAAVLILLVPAYRRDALAVLATARLVSSPRREARTTFNDRTK